MKCFLYFERVFKKISKNFQGWTSNYPPIIEKAILIHPFRDIIFLCHKKLFLSLFSHCIGPTPHLARILIDIPQSLYFWEKIKFLISPETSRIHNSHEYKVTKIDFCLLTNNNKILLSRIFKITFELITHHLIFLAHLVTHFDWNNCIQTISVQRGSKSPKKSVII